MQQPCSVLSVDEHTAVIMTAGRQTSEAQQKTTIQQLAAISSCI